MNETPKPPTEDTNETVKPTEPTKWDSLENADSPAKDEMNSIESAETHNKYEATNDEVYNALFNQFSKDLFKAEVNNMSPEAIQAASDTRDILVDVHLTNIIDSQDGKPEIPLATALEQRQNLYTKKAELYNRIGDTRRAQENADKFRYTADLIEMAVAVKKNIEDKNDPNSNYNQLASQFK